ncbi:hypothetical protein [Dyadobacter pollutisoli]|jgi:hypothetical protein|uniref:Outer membrane protein beta-barrel domain-containing protein n=1 Tax=Dyadobacter pollutisoli TaxID=2910158 RepID=A0A9E8SMP2_9BACT|nr:hypothetical protein [Dyadobacter pollutisoli]WAC14343.1 hypothetical protein ON006_10385 [Dyadobacter pollutisoli]
MKKLALTFICTLCFGFAHAQYDNWAVGFKLGEPTGVNIRKYFNNIHALDVTIGTYGGVLSNNRKYRGDEGIYKNAGLSLQVHYLWHTPLFNSEAVHVYYGLGGQVNSRRSYPKRLNGNYEKDISLGGSALGGIEYYIPDNRMSIFLEGGTYVELLPRPFYLSPNISAGVRFNL